MVLAKTTALFTARGVRKQPLPIPPPPLWHALEFQSHAQPPQTRAERSGAQLIDAYKTTLLEKNLPIPRAWYCPPASGVVNWVIKAHCCSERARAPTNRVVI